MGRDAGFTVKRRVDEYNIAIRVQLCTDIQLLMVNIRSPELICIAMRR